MKWTKLIKYPVNTSFYLIKELKMGITDDRIIELFNELPIDDESIVLRNDQEEAIYILYKRFGRWRIGGQRECKYTLELAKYIENESTKPRP